MKVLALDFGTAKIGLAIGDTKVGVASPRPFLPNNAELFSIIQELCIENTIEKIIIGLPTGLQGPTEQTNAALKFTNELKKKLNLEVELLDERFTTTIAQKNLQSAGKKSHQQKELVDSEAARVLLQEWLDSIHT